MIQYEKSALPKLLARENITVQHGNYPTAWFDVKDRILGLPLWKDKGKDVYDLLIGHEVGHAIETPFEGWHDSPEKLEGCPRSYLNVIEDARIERKILARYPGLVSSFTKGYRQLFQENFFGDVSQLDYNEVKLIDKINLKTKLRTLITVPFNAEEEVLYQRSLKTETFEDVVNLVKDILAYTKENTPELITPPPAPQDDMDMPGMEGDEEKQPQMGHDDYDMPEQESEETQTQKSEGQDSEDESDENSSSTDGTESSSQEDVTSSDDSDDADAQATTMPTDEDVSETDQAFREAEQGMVEDTEGTGIAYAKDISKEQVDNVVFSYKELQRRRNKKVSDLYYSEHTEDEDKWDSAKTYAEFQTYFKTVKKSVSNACAEFERRKAAHQYQKATTAKTGTIDVNALWSYKTNEDIFLRSTKLADAKSHGMQLLVDYSGSMSNSMRYVADQLIHTVMFCKGVNIPFEVYAFTTGNSRRLGRINRYSDEWENMTQQDRDLYDLKNKGRIDMDNLSMPLLTSSDLNKKDFEESIFYLWLRIWERGNGYYYGSYPKARIEEYGSTPLNQALIVMHKLMKKFINKHKIEKMNFITFTDGDANGLHIHGASYSPSKFRINIDGKVVESKAGSRKGVTASILKNLEKVYAANNVGFFMCDRGTDWRFRLQDAIWAQNPDIYDTDELLREKYKEYRKNKCIEFADVYGYKKWYCVKGGKQLDAQADDFDITENATQGQLTAAFKKFSKSKKNNKVLMKKFAQEVA